MTTACSVDPGGEIAQHIETALDDGDIAEARYWRDELDRRFARAWIDG